MAKSSDTLDSLLIKINYKEDPKSLTTMEKVNAILESRAEIEGNIKELQKSRSKEAKEELKRQKELLKDIKSSAKLKKSKGKIDWEEFGKKAIVQGFEKGKEILTTALDASWSSLAELMKGVTEEMGEMLEASLLTSGTTRKNVFTYGMTAGQSYGFEKTKTAMGISDEDLMYMNPKQAQLFQKTMTKYATEYNKLYDEGFFDTLMEYQIERQKFQDDVEIEIIKMLVQNKETIIGGMQAIMTIAKTVLKILDWMGGRQTASASSTIANYSNSKSVKVDATFNISGQTKDMSQVNGSDMASEFVTNTQKYLA